MRGKIQAMRLKNNKYNFFLKNIIIDARFENCYKLPNISIGT